MVVAIESYPYPAIAPLAELRKLPFIQMGSHGAGGIGKARLPEHGQVEQAFHQNHGRERADRFPGEQAAPGAGQQAVWRRGGGDAPGIEVDDALAIAPGENNAPAEGLPPLSIHQTGWPQKLARIAQRGQVLPEIPAGRVTDS
jgi:hypothetical protein